MATACKSIVEKPKPAKAPSNLAVVGRYVLTPRIFDHLEKIGEGAGGEIQLTDGIARLMQRRGGVRLPLHRASATIAAASSGYLQATVEYALGHPVLGRSFRKYLQQLDVSAGDGVARGKGNGLAVGGARARGGRRARGGTATRKST